MIGDGPVDLMLVPGFVSHLEQAWEEPSIASILRRLAGEPRLILFDRRGVGLSDRVGAAPTLDDTTADMGSVLDAAGSRRCVLLGASEGGPACALFAARHPDRVQGLIVYGALAKGARSNDYPWAIPPAVYDRWLANLVRDWGGPGGLAVFAPSRVEDPSLAQWWARMLRLGSSPAAAKAVLQAMRDIDIRDALPAIRAPTLVLHKSGDRAVMAGAGRDLADRILGAEFVELSGEDHWWWVGDVDPIVDAICRFIRSLSP